MAAQQSGRRGKKKPPPSRWQASIDEMTLLISERVTWTRERYLLGTEFGANEEATLYRDPAGAARAMFAFHSEAAYKAVIHLVAHDAGLTVDDLKRVFAPLVAMVLEIEGFTLTQQATLSEDTFPRVAQALFTEGDRIFYSLRRLYDAPLPHASSPVVQWQAIALLHCICVTEPFLDCFNWVARLMAGVILEIESPQVFRTALAFMRELIRKCDPHIACDVAYASLRTHVKLSLQPSHELCAPLREALLRVLRETLRVKDSERKVRFPPEIVGHLGTILDCALSVGLSGYIPGLWFATRFIWEERDSPEGKRDLLRLHTPAICALIVALEEKMPPASATRDEIVDFSGRISYHPDIMDVWEVLRMTQLARALLAHGICIEKEYPSMTEQGPFIPRLIDYCLSPLVEVSEALPAIIRWILDFLLDVRAMRYGSKHAWALWRVLLYSRTSRTFRNSHCDVASHDDSCAILCEQQKQYFWKALHSNLSKNMSISPDSLPSWGIIAFVSRSPEGTAILVKEDFLYLLDHMCGMIQHHLDELLAGQKLAAGQSPATTEKHIELFQLLALARDACISIAFYGDISGDRENGICCMMSETLLEIAHEHRFHRECEADILLYASLLLQRQARYHSDRDLGPINETLHAFCAPNANGATASLALWNFCINRPDGQPISPEMIEDWGDDIVGVAARATDESDRARTVRDTARDTLSILHEWSKGL